jgi:uncharacterized protein
VEARPSPIEGIRCFATRPLAAGQVVEHWRGEVVADDVLRRIEADGKYWSGVSVGEGLNLLMEVVDPHQSEVALPAGSGVGGFNHSCDPNLWLQDAVTVIARRGIRLGEELTIDDALFSVDPGWRLEPCNCGSRLCRGAVGGNDWQLPVLQERYARHFSPFINERIERLTGSAALGEASQC